MHFGSRDSGCVKNQDSDPEYGIYIPDHIFENLKHFFGVKNSYIFLADPDAGSGIFLTPDPGSGMEE